MIKPVIHNFKSHLKSYFLVTALIISFFYFPSCRFLEEQGLYKSRALKQAIIWAKQDSARVADSLKKLEIVKITVANDLKDSTVEKDMERNHKILRQQ